jgi:hypothetical protein
MIRVQRIDSATFDVTVQRHTTTTHRVTLSADYHQKLTAGKVSPEILISKSFEFLLQRESNTSILRTFDLPLIAQYFPEYETVILKMLAA